MFCFSEETSDNRDVEKEAEKEALKSEPNNDRDREKPIVKNSAP